jgi:hypothetical protein
VAYIDLNKAIYDPNGNPLTYPGERPEHPTLVMDNETYVVNVSNDYQSFLLEDGRDIDEIFKSRGLVPVSERIAQVAFGANRNIENLVWKFKHYLAQNHSINQEILILPATIPDAEVVACNIGYWGYVYAGLLTTTNAVNIRKYLNGTQCPVTLILLDEQQMKAVHQSEGVLTLGAEPPGVSCKISDITVDLSPEVSCLAQVYSLAVPFLSFDGHPLAYKSVNTRNRGNYKALNQQQLFEQINQHTGIEEYQPGRVPIAETLREKTLNMMKQNIDATRNISKDSLYASVRKSLLENFPLRDSDNQIRMGLEGIYPIRDNIEAWKPYPLFNPQFTHNSK